MKTKLCLSSTALLAAVTLGAAPLMETTAIHVQPDASTPAIGYLKAGTEPKEAANATAPAGWMAVELPGPHDAYVRNHDFTKALDVLPGAAIRQLPSADAPVLATMQDGDKIEITGLRSGWTQVKLLKDVVGYIKLGGAATPATAAVAAVAPLRPTAVTDAPPVLSSGPVSALPRTVKGMVVETRRKFLVGPRPEYDYQLNDPDGKRIAFLDVARVLPTQKMEKILEHFVNVTGVVRQSTDGKDIVIDVESFGAE
jgi:hypothetical protein